MSSTPPGVDPVGDPPSSRRSSQASEDLVRENERLRAQLRTKDLENENAALKAENDALKKKDDEREKARIAALDANQHGDSQRERPKPFVFK